MKLENSNSEIIWNSIKEIMKNMKNESNSILFTKSDGFYSIIPLSIRWKNFFLNNLFWGYTGKGQKGMIVLSNEIDKVINMLNPNIINVEEYIRVLTELSLSIHLTDWDDNRKTLQEQHKNDNYAIITQKDDKVEEFITTITTKLFFIKEGYLTGNFEIPYPDYGEGDVIGIKGDFVNKLKSKGIIPFGGDESDILIWQKLKNQPNNLDEQTETIVCEVKSSNAYGTAYQQLYERGNDSQKSGYLKSHCFNKGYACFAVPSEEEAKRRKSSNQGLKYEAGSLIFVNNKEPIFNEDPICLNPSSYRKNKALSIQENCQKELIKFANKKIARLMISNMDIMDVLKDINNMKINNIFKKTENICIGDIIHKI